MECSCPAWTLFWHTAFGLPQSAPDFAGFIKQRIFCPTSSHLFPPHPSPSSAVSLTAAQHGRYNYGDASPTHAGLRLALPELARRGLGYRLHPFAAEEYARRRSTLDLVTVRTLPDRGLRIRPAFVGKQGWIPRCAISPKRRREHPQFHLPLPRPCQGHS